MGIETVNPEVWTCAETGMTLAGEEVISNGKKGEAKLCICVPTWKDNADALFASLIRMSGAEACTLLVFDDGSVDADLTRQLTRQIRRYPGPARLVSAPKNAGRSHARNRLMALAETEWILYLDADMQPDDDAFLSRYLEAIAGANGPALFVGGFSLKHAVPTAETRLHAAQSRGSECLPASVRATAPGRYVFTSNLLVHADILKAVAFDSGFEGWGWEDVDWGLRVAERFPVHHIDNAATHLGLDDDATLMAKYAASDDNFLRMLERHPEQMRRARLFRMAKLISHLPHRLPIKKVANQLARTRGLPLKARLLALKTYRAALYGARL